MEHTLQGEQNDNHEGDSTKRGISRRHFIRNITVAGAGFTLIPFLIGDASAAEEAEVYEPEAVTTVAVVIVVNGEKHSLSIDPRTTLLDLLRETLSLPGTKKGCDHGQCGACTVLVNDRRVNSCLLLGAACQNASVTTIEGIADGDKLHPIQAAFIKHDAFQCGYCTPGQICSAIGLIKEGHARSVSDISELMSGNICRCGAYQNINNAIREIQKI